MISVPEHFEFLFTTDCHYSRPKVDRQTIIICVRGLGLMKGHPLRTESSEGLVPVPRCHFVFEGVTSSTRRLTPYLDAKLGVFGESYLETDITSSGKPKGHEYVFEGRLDEPNAFVDWVIYASSFKLEIP